MKNSEGSFKKDYPFEKRQSEARRILNKFSDRVPVIVQISKKSLNDLPTLDKHKYLVPQDLTVGQFLYVIRRRIKITPEKAIYMFFNNTLEPTSGCMADVYKRHRDDDNFLYTTVSLTSGLGGVVNDSAAF